jgi:branched-chain amino acid transport system permease protein
MRLVIDLVLPGLVVGCLYGLIGTAFAIVYKATRVVNFALGEMMMLTAYIAYSVQGYLTLPFPVLVIATVLIAALVAGLVEHLVIRPMQSEPIFSIVMATIGLAIILRSLVVLIWGALPQPINSGLPDRFINVLGVGLTIDQVILVGLLAASCAAIFTFFQYTSFGLAMRATASSETTALLMGIRIGQVQTVAWAISSIVAGLAGVLAASIYSLTPEMYALGLKGFPATILGGLDSVLGSALGGLFIGAVENLSGGLLGSGMKEIAGFTIIVFVLMIRPYGLFGQHEIERV